MCSWPAFSDQAARSKACEVASGTNSCIRENSVVFLAGGQAVDMKTILEGDANWILWIVLT